MTVGPILLVEDNQDDVELTVRALRDGRIGNDLVVVNDGAQALAHLLPSAVDVEAMGGPPMLPALILLDLSLPKVGGLEVLRQLRAHDRTRNVPTVILTSSRQEDDLAKAYALGANSYVRKPIDFNDFVEVVHQLRLYWLVLNEPPPEVKAGF
ncbi:MAG: response regulator [Actinobacteria bacterium]|nr:response regulator [Actinomycetota bacterium]